jgi:steroid 5-alpha reductase family enzyme
MTVLYLEALAAIALSLSILMAIAWTVQQRTGNSGWVDTIWTFSQGVVGAGSALWPVAGEALADAQLKEFRDNPANKGRVCDAGFWRWSRHPNYFFEWFGWLAYPVIAISPAYAWGWATLLAPVFMYWILVHVTGIPPLEAQMLRSRGERYRDYQSRTSAFFPLPPQKGVVT